MRLFPVIGLLVSCLFWGPALLDADRARRAEGHWKNVRRAEARLVQNDWQGSDDDYAHLIGLAVKAKDYQPGNIKYHHWLNVYRWHAISRVTDPNTGEVLLPPQSLEFVEHIATELSTAATLCPTFGPTWCVLGQLEKFVLRRQEKGARYIRTGCRLAPCDPTTCFVAGLLSAEEGHAEEAYDHWKQAIELDGALFANVCSRLINALRRPDLAFKLPMADARHLVLLEQILQQSDQYPEWLAKTTERIVALLEQQCKVMNAAAWKFAWLAERYHHQDRFDEAIAMYRQALAAEYGQVSWRYSLAELYAERGLLSDAIAELTVCLRLRPQHPTAHGYLERLQAQLSATDPSR